MNQYIMGMKSNRNERRNRVLAEASAEDSKSF